MVESYGWRGVRAFPRMRSRCCTRPCAVLESGNMGNPPQRNIQQHYVTAAYLVGFTPEGTRDSQLYVYERNTERMFRLVADEAAKRRNYYSAPLPQGGFDDSVDTMLTALEGQAMPSLQKILAGDYSLSTFERALLAFLIAFQEFRTPWTCRYSCRCRKIFRPRRCTCWRTNRACSSEYLRN